MGSAVRSSPRANFPTRKLLLPHGKYIVPAFFRLLCVNRDPSPGVCLVISAWIFSSLAIPTFRTKCFQKRLQVNSGLGWIK